MSKRKFGLSLELTAGLSETIKAAHNNAGNLRFAAIALTRVETDPENPRELALTAEDIVHGIRKEDPDFEKKQAELVSLQGLASTIKNKGLINPIVVYEYNNKYRLVAGERRYLASHIVGKDDIPARILGEKPSEVDLRLLQWIENTGREDLSLRERFLNIETIVQELKKKGEELGPTLLKDILGLSLTQTSDYMTLINGPSDLKDKILTGEITNIHKATLIARAESKDIRASMIDACMKGVGVKEMKLMLTQYKKQQKEHKHNLLKKRGRGWSKVTLGFTKQPSVVKKIIYAVLDQPQYQHHKEVFSKTDWDMHEHSTKAFKRLLEILEMEIEGRA